MGRIFPQGNFKWGSNLEMEKVEGGILAAVAGGLGELVMGMKGDAEGERLRDVRAAVERGMEGTGGGGGDRRDCLLAGLWVLEGDLARAHRLCQDVGTTRGAAWHAVVHRMEGDFWNSKYWWRRTGAVRWEGGETEALRGILARAPAAEEVKGLAERYEPVRFVDLVERHHGAAAWREALVAVQRWEWVGLFRETAGGG